MTWINWTKVGICSICKGDVMKYTGAWYSVRPTPDNECKSCGAGPNYPVMDMKK